MFITCGLKCSEHSLFFLFTVILCDPPIRCIIVPLKLQFKKFPSPVTKMYPNESFHHIKLTKSSSKSFRVCCPRGTAEFSSVRQWKEYSTLPCKRLKMSWLHEVLKFLRRNKIPLRNLCVFKDGKHLLHPKHYHFLGVTLMNSMQIKIRYSRKLRLAGSSWKKWYNESHFLKNLALKFLGFCLHWS